MNTEAVNPIIQKARWIAAKLISQGAKSLLPEESVFIAELSRRGACGDRTAIRLAQQIQAAHLEFQLKLEAAR